MPASGHAFCDPSTAFDASGTAYLSTLGNGSIGTDGYYVETSGNNCVSWSSQVNGNNVSDVIDKDMTTAVDEMQTSPYANYFYAAWMDEGNSNIVTINRSIDGGNNFDQEHTLSSGWGQGVNIQTGPTGQIYVCWADYSSTNNYPAHNIGFAVSTDGGQNYTSSLPSNLAFTGIRLSNDGAPNFNNTRVNDFPSMAVDKSCGPNNGRIYIVFPASLITPVTSSNLTSQINMSYSDDGGTTWTTPQVINIFASNESWFPWVSVDDETGLVAVAYYCMDQSGSYATNTYVAYSMDGSNWGNVKVSSASHTPSAISGFASGYAGDYIGIASFGGSSYASWHDNRSGTWQVYMARIDYNVPILTSSLTNLQVCPTPSTISGNKNYEAADQIAVSNCGGTVSIASSANVTMTAGQSIVIGPGFSTQPGAVFTAQIKNITPCETPGAVFFKNNPNVWVSDSAITKNNIAGMQVFAYPNPTRDLITVGALNNNYQNVSFTVTDVAGRYMAKYNNPDLSSGNVRQIIDVGSYASGIYTVTMEANNQKYPFKFVKE